MQIFIHYARDPPQLGRFGPQKMQVLLQRFFRNSKQTNITSKRLRVTWRTITSCSPVQDYTQRILNIPSITFFFSFSTKTETKTNCSNNKPNSHLRNATEKKRIIQTDFETQNGRHTLIYVQNETTLFTTNFFLKYLFLFMKQITNIEGSDCKPSTL